MAGSSLGAVEERFQCAVEVIQKLPKKSTFQPTREMMLRFYALYKQATQGPCTGPRPRIWDPIGQYKWDAWSSLGNMAKHEAMEAYVEDMKNIIEVMPQTDEVAVFTQSLGRFYEAVDLEPPQLPVKRKSRSNSPSRSSSVTNSRPVTPPRPPRVESDTEDQFEDTSETFLLQGEGNQSVNNGDNNEGMIAQGLRAAIASSGLASLSETPHHGHSEAVLESLQHLQRDISSLVVKVSSLEESVQRLLIINNVPQPTTASAERATQATVMTLVPRSIRRFLTAPIPTWLFGLVIFLWPLISGIIIQRRLARMQRRGG